MLVIYGVLLLVKSAMPDTPFRIGFATGLMSESMICAVNKFCHHFKTDAITFCCHAGIWAGIFGRDSSFFLSPRRPERNTPIAQTPNTALSQPATICRKEDKAQYKDLYDPDKLLRLFTDRFRGKYGVECVTALHHNKPKTNYHIHLIF
ncbi:MAG: hypothetical protein NC389_17590, partial [Acetatifactor muris]|nr:hypothetical protein [Acetatifactor muris]